MSDIGVKLGVEGEAQFKKALGEINTNLKTLGTEMKAVTSAFDRNDTSVENLAGRNQVLNKQIDEQKNKLDLLKGKLAESAKEYGENDAKTQKWQQAVNLATADLNKMERQLDGNNKELDEAAKASDKAGDAIDEAGDSADKSGGKFEKLGGVLKGIGVGMAAVAAAAGAAALAIGKQVVSAYADYEQLVGGVETLFGGANVSAEEFAKTNKISLEQAEIGLAHYGDQAEVALNHAENAYKTAGLSANEYMETVTGFSASLISSLGEYSYQAANYADAAVIQMADNANKMGSEMGSIQNAYQGFAKQNYTMLDNLKLGYGGTKSEMERLLRDAEKYGGLIEGSFSVENFANIVDAIGLIQDELGITGTTALEAEETISGSVNAMKSAWQNWLVGLGNSKADMTKLTQNLVDGFANIVKNITPIIENIVSALPAALEALLPAIAGLLPMLLETATGLFGQVVGAIMQLLPELIPVAVDALLTIVDTLIANIPMLIDAAMVLITSLAGGLIDALPELIPAAVDAVITVVETLIDNIDMLIDAAIAIQVALADGLIEALPKLLEKAPEIIIKLVKAIIENVPKMLEAAVALMVQLSSGIASGFGEILGKVGGWINDNIVQPIKDKVSDFVSAGGDLIAGVWQGISDKATWLWEQVSGFFSTLTGKIKDFFGIASPSKLFRDEIGANLASGIGVGFEKQMKSVAQQMNASIPTSFDSPSLATANAVSGAVSGMAALMGAQGGGNYTINVVLPDGKALASVVFDPIRGIAKQRGVALA